MELAKFVAHSSRVEIEDLDWGLARRVGLCREDATLLAHFASIEDQTPFYMRELLNTPARHQRDIVGFLTMWSYEEFFHARAIERLLDACGHGDLLADAVAIRSRVTLRSHVEEIAQTALARIAPRAFTALYFTWGASQEYLTTHGYAAMAARSTNPVVREVCLRIARQERRHFAWCYGGARRHLADSPFGQRLTRLALDRVWTPVGQGVKTAAEVAGFVRTLFAGAHDRRLEGLQHKLRALPGLEAVTGVVRYGAKVTGDAPPVFEAEEPLGEGTVARAA